MAQATSADRTFISQFNVKLNAWAKKSNIKLRYRDIVAISESFYGDYLSIKKPVFTFISNGIEYQLTTQNIALSKQDEGRSLHLPTDYVLTLKRVGAPAPADPETYELEIRGLPELLLKTNASQQVTKVKFISPTASFVEPSKEVTVDVSRVWSPAGRKEVISTGQLRFAKLAARYDTWLEVDPLAVSAIFQWLESVRSAAQP